jgi:hypothetical protein
MTRFLRTLLAASVITMCGQAMAAELVSFGPKADTLMSVASKSGTNTSHAKATLIYNAKTIDAICLKVDGSTKPDECFVKSHPSAPGPEVRRIITANCETGEFQPTAGGKVTFAGPDQKQATSYNYLLVRDGQLLAYPQHGIAMSAYRVLCPASVPLPDERRLNQ